MGETALRHRAVPQFGVGAAYRSPQRTALYGCPPDFNVIDAPATAAALDFCVSISPGLSSSTMTGPWPRFTARAMQ
jgi:hypothetical protein